MKSVDGVELGHVDLIARGVVATGPQFESELTDCLRRWTAGSEIVGELPPKAVITPLDAVVLQLEIEAHVPNRIDEPLVVAPDRDHATNIAGSAARAKRDEVNAQAPVKNFVARMLGVKTDERAWRIGAKGEEKVAKKLAKLGPAWRVLHAVEVGTRGSDIDHILIGPAGVFTLNAKCHPGAKAWVGERSVMVNGQRTRYLRNARFEAERATRLLTAACGFEVAVRACVVFVDLQIFDVKQMPPDVQVTTRKRLLPWLMSLPCSLEIGAIEAIHAKARFASTWQ